MKNKLFKALCLFAFLFISSKSFGQTEEETKVWLQEKLQKYYKFYGDKTTVKVTECSITFSYNILPNTDNSQNKSYYNQYHIFPTDGLIFSYRQGVTTWSGSDDFIDIQIKDNLKRIRAKNFSELETLTNSSEIQVIPGEENLAERLQKAVDHLATFCHKKKEVF